MCGPLRGAICGAIVFEGWAPDLAAAEKLAASGGVTFAPNHHFGAVGPMTGITTRSMPLLVVENRAFGNRAFCALNEGLGKVMRFGGNDAEVLARLALAARRVRSAARRRRCARAAASRSNPLIARGLAMGDEMHQRNVACSSLLLRSLRRGSRAATTRKRWQGRSTSSPATTSSSSTSPWRWARASSTRRAASPARRVVTAMCRNGTDFGIRVAGRGDELVHRAGRDAAGPVLSRLQRGGRESRHRRLGDRRDDRPGRVRDGGGAGGRGLRRRGRLRATRSATRARWARSRSGATRTGPSRRSSSRGVPIGIDVRRVVETGIAPAINTGIAHREPGVGQVGAGVARAPLACFERALALARAEGDVSARR